ncbi:MAG: EF-hand domain-containing protein [Pseudomonadota bacterium]
MDNATKKILLATVLIAVGAGATMAQDGPGRGGERMNFETLDVDGNGEITAEDLAAMRANRFGEIDANGDGSVTLEEFQAAASARATEQAAERFARLDADGDGSLSRDALEARGRGNPGERMLRRFDADNSGGIDAEEFETAMARFAERRGGRDGGKRK